MKNVLITGATGNLGKTVVSRFLKENYQVFFTHTPGKPIATPATGTVPYAADLSKEELAIAAVNKIVSDHKTIDVAVLMAGGFMPGGIDQADGKSLEKMFSINFNTTYFVARPVFQHMMNQANGGRIIVVGARPVLRPKDGKNLVAYTLSKSLVFKLAELLNAEGASKNVITSVIVPSTIDTETNRQAMPAADFTKWVRPEDIAETMIFLSSSAGQPLRENVIKMYGAA
jgi:NAD(P)-dependent dehydrogenase (short-subunit alcohol dehydrogenase family)